GCYMNMESVLSYQVNTANDVAFPIMVINLELTTFAYNALLDAHYAYGYFNGVDGVSQLNTELMQTEGPVFSIGTNEVVGDTMDSVNGYWSLCGKQSGIGDGHRVITVDLTTGKLRQDFTIS